MNNEYNSAHVHTQIVISQDKNAVTPSFLSYRGTERERSITNIQYGLICIPYATFRKK